jgi:hypothetical protein
MAASEGRGRTADPKIARLSRALIEECVMLEIGILLLAGAVLATFAARAFYLRPSRARWATCVRPYVRCGSRRLALRW